ncbi:MAG TPA: YecA family protein [Caldimonas sp.]|jgi:uncharacterized protein|nr:YecA family protein [Caldimonas sp.]HEX4234413.1 YecA family protein [Caldimonas sp.]
MATKRSRPGPARGAGKAPAPLGEREIAELQTLLDTVPAPLEPLDVCALDGFLCGVLVQPEAVAAASWLPFVTDVDARPLPAGFDARRIHALVGRRADELRRAIERRTWFDPWVFEADADLAGDDPIDLDEGDDDDLSDEAADDDEGAGVEAVLPWVAGFTAALETFPALLGTDSGALTAPLALLYRHVGTETLEDADALRAEIETLAAPADLAEAVEELVRATLLLADVVGTRAAR